MSQTCTENQTQELHSVTFSENVYKTMWKNTVEPERPQMTLRRMRTTRWTTMATDTLAKYEILIAFPLQRRLRECAPILPSSL